MRWDKKSEFKKGRNIHKIVSQYIYIYICLKGKEIKGKKNFKKCKKSRKVYERYISILVNIRGQEGRGGFFVFKGKGGGGSF